MICSTLKKKKQPQQLVTGSVKSLNNGEVLSNELTRLSLSFDRMFAEHVGCDMSGLKECLMKKSVGDILAAQENITGTALSGDLFLPVVDDNFLHGKSAEKKKHYSFLVMSLAC